MRSVIARLPVPTSHILARLRTLRNDVIDPFIAVHNGRVVKRTGDGSIERQLTPRWRPEMRPAVDDGVEFMELGALAEAA
jgi:hypothetical protein